jgi:alkanesulfonate monooxygenase SsuD/methylene tetrahydromethanopterin reductase-like flavin-dependent oxidoreductase (luciferase family)
MTARPCVPVVIPHTIRSNADDLSAFGRQVEDAGLDGVFTGDHLAAAAPLTDSTLTLTVAAVATTRIRSRAELAGRLAPR